MIKKIRQSKWYRTIRKSFAVQALRFCRYYLFPIKFKWAQIENTTICNRSCSYCPNSTIGRPKELMRDEIYYKIIDDLARMDYKGGVVFSGHGEPLTDPRIVSFISYARERLSYSAIMMFTSGDYLSVDKYLELKKGGLNFIVISQHSEELPDNIKNTISQIKNNYPQEYSIEIEDTFHKEKDNRGGLVDVPPVYKDECPMPDMLTVDYNGNVILCCYDYLSSIIFGNIEEYNIKDIWYKEEFKRARAMTTSGFWPYDICRRCIGVMKPDRKRGQATF